MSELEEIKKKEDKSRAEKRMILESSDFQDRLINLREEKPNASWADIARDLQEEFNMEFTGGNLKSKYEKELAMDVQISGYAEKQFNKYIGSMAKRYDRLIKITDRLLKAMDDITERMTDAENEELDNLLRLMKFIKPLYTLNKSVLEQMGFVREEQEKIIKKVSMNKTHQSDEDIREKVYEYLPSILDTLKKKGKIEIYDENVLK